VAAMNLFLREMKASRKSLIGWCIAILIMVYAGMSKYGGLSGSSQSLDELMKSMPKSLQAVFGVGTVDLSTAIGYFSILYLYLVLMGTIHALMLGANILSKEERDRTAEFLMTKPISRARIITLKLVAAIVNITVFNLVTLVSSIQAVAYYHDGEPVVKEIVLMMAGLYLLQWIFLSLGMGIAAVSNRPKMSVSLGTGLLLFTFILSIVIDLNSKLDCLKYITPFKYFEGDIILEEKALDPVFIVLSGVIIALCISITYIFYTKRDLNI
jgi:ABC-2 type transport system permease protein